MCYDAKTSLSTFIIGSVFLLFLFIRNYQLDRFFVFVWIPVILIQLCEYFMWKDQKCGDVNRLNFNLWISIIKISTFICSIRCKIFC